MKKGKKKQTIKVCYKDSFVEKIPQRLWDDYEYINNIFVVKRNGVWIGMYNMDTIACIVVG